MSAKIIEFPKLRRFIEAVPEEEQADGSKLPDDIQQMVNEGLLQVRPDQSWLEALEKLAIDTLRGGE